MVTIKTVAARAGVSIGTVSNVLSGKRPVSDEVRQRVLIAIDDLGYQPNMVAHSLVTGQSSIIGLVVPDFTIEGLITAIDLEATRMGYSLLVSKLNQGEDPVKHLHSLVGRRVEGVVWCIPENDNDYQWANDAQLDFGLPIILALCTHRPRYSSVWMDNFSGGYQATQHLIQHGCQRIAHITGPMNLRESKDRKAGWEIALKEAGLESCRIIEGGWGVRNGCDSIKNLLEKWPDFDAVFIASDKPALGAINFLQRSGRKVPDDIKVVGFDDVIDLDYYNPPLTTIHQDYGVLGVSLVKELSRRIQTPATEPRALVLPTHLVIRNSCGCPLPLQAEC